VSAHAAQQHAGHAHAASSSHKLAVAFFIGLAVLAIEVVGGLASNSLALLSDAGHVLTDVLAIALAWFASVQAERPPTARQTYGFHRAGILAALVNATSLVVLSLFLIYEAYQRLFEPEAIASNIMLGVAIVGLVANVGVALYLREPGGANLNMRAALVHVVGDALASVAVIGGAIAIALGGPVQIDPLLTMLISVILMVGAWTIGRETLDILMESAPAGVDVDKLVEDLQTLPGVVAVHDVHVWSLASHLPAMSAHVRIDGAAHADGDRVLGEVQHLVAEHYRITHTTIQIECDASDAACADAGAGVGCPPPAPREDRAQVRHLH
jgi:cobalt-zinc-cadmium efflux system protein